MSRDVIAQAERLAELARTLDARVATRRAETVHAEVAEIRARSAAEIEAERVAEHESERLIELLGEFALYAERGLVPEPVLARAQIARGLRGQGELWAVVAGEAKAPALVADRRGALWRPGRRGDPVVWLMGVLAAGMGALTFGAGRVGFGWMRQMLDGMDTGPMSDLTGPVMAFVLLLIMVGVPGACALGALGWMMERRTKGPIRSLEPTGELGDDERRGALEWLERAIGRARAEAGIASPVAAPANEMLAVAERRSGRGVRVD